MTRYAYERVQAGLAMPGVFEVNRSVPVGLVIEEIILIAEGSNEWRMGRTSAISASPLKSQLSLTIQMQRTVDSHWC